MEANNAPETAGTASSAARDAIPHRGGDQPFRRRVRDGRTGRHLPGVRAGGLGEAVVGEHPVHHVPLLQRRGRVALAREDQLPRAGRARPLGQPLRAAHRRGQPDDDLHQPERRALGGEQDVAGQRDLERGGEGEAVRGEDRRHRQVLQGLCDAQQPRPQRARALHRLRVVGDRLEQRHVHPAGDDLAARLDQHRARPVRVAGVGERDQLTDGVRPAREHLLVEQVQRRLVEDDDGDVTVALDPDGVGHDPILPRVGVSTPTPASRRPRQRPRASTVNVGGSPHSIGITEASPT